MQLSCGPWTYNRFQKFEQSLQEEKLDEGMPPWLKDKEDDKSDDGDKKAEKKDDKKSDKKSKKDCDCKEEVIQALMDGGLANNPVSAEIIAEHMSEAWREAILSEKKSEAEREARRLEKEYERSGESKDKSDDVKKAEERQAKKDKTLGTTKKLRLRDKRKGEGLGVKPLANRAQKNAGRGDKAQPDVHGGVMRG